MFRWEGEFLSVQLVALFIYLPLCYGLVKSCYNFVLINLLSAFYFHSNLSIYQSLHILFVSISQTSSLNIHTGVNDIWSSILTLKTTVT